MDFRASLRRWIRWLFPVRSRRRARLQRWILVPRRRRSPDGSLLKGIRKDGRRRILFCLNEGPGGVARTTGDLARELEGELDCWVLVGSLHRIELWSLREPRRPAAEWWLDPCWSARRRRREDYRRIYGEVLAAVEPTVVHVRHLLGHTLDLLDLCREVGPPVVFSYHDYFPACPSVHLLDDRGVFCDGICTPSTGQCRLPISWLDDLPVLKSGFLEEWRADLSAALAGVQAVVTTSEDTRDRILRVHAGVLERDVRVIEHGRDLEDDLRLARPPEPEGTVRLLAAGHLDEHKGAEVLRQLVLADRRAGGRFELHCLGPVPEALKDVAVCHGRYDREEFAEKVERIRPSLALVLSIWAETYSHTLTEAWSVGLPVLAFDLGAPAERIRARGGGWLMPVSPGDAVRRRLLEIVARREDWEARSARASVRDLPSVARMADEYRRLYAELAAPS